MCKADHLASVVLDTMAAARYFEETLVMLYISVYKSVRTVLFLVGHERYYQEYM